MDRNDRLYSEYEDALFALLMDKVAQEEGARLLEENERLKDDPDAAVPPELDQKTLETIRRAISGRRRHHTHTVGWYLGRLAIAILAALLLFAVAYASIPDLQLRTLEMLIENSDVSSRLSFAFGGNTGKELVDTPQTLAGYTLPELSRQYAIVDQGETSREAWIMYQHENGSVIRIKITNSEDLFLDSEAIEDCQDIEIHGFHGKAYYDQKGAAYVSWYDTAHEKVVTLYATGLDKEMARTYAEQISYAG